MVRVTCAAGWVTTLAGIVESGVPGAGWCHFAVPGLYNFLDLPDIACLTVPRALQLMALKNEPFFPGFDADDAFKKVRKVYEMAEKADDFFSQTYSGKSCFTSQMFADTLRWFKRWL